MIRDRGTCLMRLTRSLLLALAVLNQCADAGDKTDQILDSIERLVGFFGSSAAEDRELVDGIYGLRVAQGVLEKVASYNHAPPSCISRSQALRRQLAKIAGDSEKAARRNHVAYYNMFKPIEHAAIPAPARISDGGLQTLDNAPQSQRLQHVFDEQKSDQCIAQVLGTAKTNNCKLSSSCWAMMTNHGVSGYRLTHQVLLACPCTTYVLMVMCP